MALVQLDLFGWTRPEPEPDTVAVAKQGITVDDLSDSLIRHFGHWVGQYQNLLEDDWTVCETLVGIQNGSPVSKYARSTRPKHGIEHGDVSTNST